MAGILKTKVSTYEFDLDVIKNLIAADIGVTPVRVDVEYVIQEVPGTGGLERGPSTRVVTKVRATVTH